MTVRNNLELKALMMMREEPGADLFGLLLQIQRMKQVSDEAEETELARMGIQEKMLQR